MSERTHAGAEQALKQAENAARRGDIKEAERWSKTAERLSQAAERLAALPAAPEIDDNDEERKAELRRRLQRYAAADADIQAWEKERDAYHAARTAALANNTDPPPELRPHPAGALGEEAYRTEILVGEE